MAALAIFVYLSISCPAQSPDLQSIKGELRSNSPIDFHDHRIEAREFGVHGEVYRAEPSLDGAFELRHIPTGDYLLLVTSANGDTIQQEFVTVNRATSHLEIRLARPAKTLTTPGTVSIAQLQHPPDRKAIQAFFAAQRFAKSGDSQKAVEELERAVRISPEFADAYTNLAVQHMRMHRYQEAAAELTRALQIAGPNAVMLSNLAYAQVYLGRVAESLASVRAALRLDSGFLQAHLILGTILLNDPRTRAEAIPHLELAAEKYPSARDLLEQARKGMPEPSPPAEAKN
jgi:tetratricopeptide (TPR) repeat protein